MSVHPIASDSGYSPPLHIGLELHGQRFDVAEIGPEFVRVRGAVPVAPGVSCSLSSKRVSIFHVLPWSLLSINSDVSLGPSSVPRSLPSWVLILDSLGWAAGSSLQ